MRIHTAVSLTILDDAPYGSQYLGGGLACLRVHRPHNFRKDCHGLEGKGEKGSRRRRCNHAFGQRQGSLQAECQALRSELEAAREEILLLQKRQELVVNRIDWVIDSLHNLLEDEE